MRWLKKILALLFDCHTGGNFLPLVFTSLMILVFVMSVIQPIKFTLRTTVVREESVILMSSYYCLHSYTLSGISRKYQNLTAEGKYSCYWKLRWRCCCLSEMLGFIFTNREFRMSFMFIYNCQISVTCIDILSECSQINMSQWRWIFRSKWCVQGVRMV